MYTLNIVSEALTSYSQNCNILNVSASTQLSIRPNKMFKAIKFVTCTREVKGSNLGLDNGIFWGKKIVFGSPSRKIARVPRLCHKCLLPNPF
jgi:hypothetical protein